MNVQQIYTIINTVTNEELGLSEVVQEDLSNIVDVGTAVFNANALDNYVKSLVDHIGRVVFVNRPYRGSAPSVIMDGWEYGSVLEKITCDLPEATENESWELTNGQSYDPNVFYKPTVSAKFYNKRVTFEIPMSFTERQVKESFSSAEQLNAFMSMLYTAIEEFTKNGLKFTMNDVEKALGISKKTIYTVFESKQDVLMAIADRYARDFTDMRQEIEADTELDTLEKLERLF